MASPDLRIASSPSAASSSQHCQPHFWQQPVCKADRSPFTSMTLLSAPLTTPTGFVPLLTRLMPAPSTETAHCSLWNCQALGQEGHQPELVAATASGYQQASHLLIFVLCRPKCSKRCCRPRMVTWDSCRSMHPLGDRSSMAVQQDSHFLCHTCETPSAQSHKYTKFVKPATHCA